MVNFYLKIRLYFFLLFHIFFFLQNYVLIVVIFFFFHSLVPLEIELFELVDVYNTLQVWLFNNLLFNLLLLLLVFILILLINFFINWNNKKSMFLFNLLLFIFFLFNLLLILWDFLFSTLTNTLFWNNFKLFYLQSKTSLTYNNVLYSSDQFDWHRETSDFFIFRFEHLYIFNIQLLSIFSFLCILFILFLFLNDIFNNFFNNKDISYCSFSVLYTWVNNCLFIFFINYILLFLVGLRVSMKILLENWDYFFFI